MTQPMPEALVQSSEYAQELVQQGFRPNEVDMNAMLAQMAKLQAQVDALNAERGVPIDAVDGHRKHLFGHVKLRDTARPDVDMQEVNTLLSMLPERSDDITAKDTEALHFAMEQLVKAHPGKELDYLSVLTAELHQMVLNRENRSGLTHDRVNALETSLAAMQAQFENLHSEVHAKADENAALHQKVQDMAEKLAAQEAAPTVAPETPSNG